MNPLCQCGCGREVRKPQNKYVQGHVGFQRRALTDEQVEEAAQLREAGMSQAAVARRFGTTQATILNRVDYYGSYVTPEKHEYTVITPEDIELKYALRALRQATRDVLDCVKRVARNKKRPHPPS